MTIGGRFDDGFGLLHLGTLLIVVLVWVAIIAAIVLGIRWLVRSLGGGPQGGGQPRIAPRPDDPLEILRGRYARGEIDDEEYERRRRTLGG
ncbi:MAG: SHOCT domain-containing protein [Chloroflexi bacterium]|nr:SHOCT domain-containing protein [Chloroflexota bacterium]